MPIGAHVSQSVYAGYTIQWGNQAGGLFHQVRSALLPSSLSLSLLHVAAPRLNLFSSLSPTHLVHCTTHEWPQVEFENLGLLVEDGIFMAKWPAKAVFLYR